jgi:hypothetical protein
MATAVCSPPIARPSAGSPHPVVRAAALTVALFMAGCSADRGGVTVTGSWGGTNAAFDATASGATLQFKCGARGEVGSPVRLDTDGRFDVAGSYDPVVVAGGARPAAFRGQVQGSQMTLSVAVEGTALGPYGLTRDQPPRFDDCNF